MILKIDAKQLEWRSYIYWSNDKIGKEELWDGEDIHANNIEDLSLPSRLIAKKFIFRKIYLGPPYAYSVDIDFADVSKDVGFWAQVIEKADAKYYGLHKHQMQMLRDAQNKVPIVTPTGREYLFEHKKKKDGSYGISIYDVANWPNQGYASDLMTIARISMRQRLKKIPAYNEGRILITNTVFDDIELEVDTDPDLMYNISILAEDVFKDIPKNFELVYKKKFDIPMEAEVSFGLNFAEMTEFNREKGVEQFGNYCD